MSLDPTDVFGKIRTKIEGIVGKTPVYVSEIPPDEHVPVDSNGVMLPFVALFYGGPLRAARDRSLVTTRRDVSILFVTVEVYAPTQAIAMKLKGKLIGELTGFKDGGNMSELTLSGMGLSRSRASNAIRQTQYIEAQSWQCLSNLESMV